MNASKSNDITRDNVRHVNPPDLSRSVETIDLLESDSDVIEDHDSINDDYSLSSKNAGKKVKRKIKFMT